MNFNEFSQNVGMWVIVLVMLAVVLALGGLPSGLRNKLLEKGHPLGRWLDDHIVVVQIVWIALLLFLSSKIAL